MTEERRERRALLVSITGAACIAGLGITWGIVSGSQMILFDGVYSLLGVGLGWLALYAAGLAREGPSERWPYGRDAAIPFVIGIEGIALLGTCLYAAVDAVLTILAGGSDVSPGWATLYAAISLVVPLAIARWLRVTSPRSELVHAEATQWLVGGLLGLGMLVGFGSVWVLQGSRWEQATSYVDPTMVLVSCVAFVVAPVRMLRTMAVELLEGLPPEAVRRTVATVVDEVRHQFGFDEPRLRMTKVGNKLYVEVDFLVSPEMRVGDADDVRRAVRDRLVPLPYDLWLNVELSADASYGA